MPRSTARQDSAEVLGPRPELSQPFFALNCGRGSVGCSKLRMISTMPNSPMTKGRKSIPSHSSETPNV